MTKKSPQATITVTIEGDDPDTIELARTELVDEIADRTHGRGDQLTITVE